nr:MAG TPA: hypothetical protein [Inoviridae sp.]
MICHNAQLESSPGALFFVQSVPNYTKYAFCIINYIFIQG